MTENTDKAKAGPLGWNLPFARARLRESGRYRGGGVPFGYVIEDGHLVKDFFQQKAIERMRKLHDYGIPLRQIAQTMAEDGFSVSHMTICRILKRTKGDNA